MKNGFFSLILVFLMVKPLFAVETPANDYPEGDIEKFFTRIKNACDHPETAGNQLPPDHIMISCETNQLDWVPGKTGRMTRSLTRSASLDVAIFCDKDLGKLKENFQFSVSPVLANCPEFDQIKITKKLTVNKITCDDVRAYVTAGGFCDKVLEDAVPTVTPTGKTVNLCGKGSGQEPPYATGSNLNYSVRN